ncbi:hypothetical protein [uncultured Winogradskyella sp.]|uniref:hypothetical protein n=1 Tax=uncultured Winogradskyella sp. TaxID=395353 RepID=UPI002614805D|nr:hypothetical protein [uncultured Winogradskyella sp.]
MKTFNTKKNLYLRSILNVKTLFLITLLTLFSCSENPEIYLDHLNGYWEIEEVTLSNGIKKQYKYNETIDYIAVNDSLKGFRKKLKPGINETYYTSDDAEVFTIKLENDSLNIYYVTPYAIWKETVLMASETQLKVSNQNKDVYLYKRYTPIKLNIE